KECGGSYRWRTFLGDVDYTFEIEREIGPAFDDREDRKQRVMRTGEWKRAVMDLLRHFDLPSAQIDGVGSGRGEPSPIVRIHRQAHGIRRHLSDRRAIV